MNIPKNLLMSNYSVHDNDYLFIYLELNMFILISTSWI